jgi:hypothetical protein
VSLAYIRQAYTVPAVRGAVVEYKGKRGRLCGAAGARLSIRLDGERRSRRYHPHDENLKWVFHEGGGPIVRYSHREPQRGGSEGQL